MLSSNKEGKMKEKAADGLGQKAFIRLQRLLSE
jgi:hypothetical protein